MSQENNAEDPATASLQSLRALWQRITWLAMLEVPLVRMLKRTSDIALSICALAVILPLFPLLALLVWFDSPGPIFYRQRRVVRALGRNDDGTLRLQTFWMWKFRTMRVDAEKLTGAVLAKHGDARITRVGAFLRKTRIDELPQFMHVLLGDMSVVGPRPERPEVLAQLVEQIPCFEERVVDLKPGITGLAQISLRYSGDAPAGSTFVDAIDPSATEVPRSELIAGMRLKLAFDMTYSASVTTPWSLLRTDLMILLRTPLVMLRGLGQ